jgi:asparagine synthase (glutamine-hydrolysing)
MCGIAGILNLANDDLIGEQAMRRMLATIRNRGPDQFGIYLDRGVALGNARLSIIDLGNGQQPISNEDGSMWIVFNGEIFNYIELRPELEALGHRFSTESDTEVLLHMYEQYGPQCLERLNGQFAFAVWNARDRSLFLARDRLGVRPLFYTVSEQRLIFGSTIKTLLTQRQVSAEIDPAVLDQIFCFWAPLTPRTVFRGIQEIPPGHYLLARDGQITVERYWQLDFPSTCASSDPRHLNLSTEDYLNQLSTLLIDAIRIRLRADVPVGAYLSGGLDSSLIASLVRKFTNNRLHTFSIAFSDTHYDESAFQARMARFLGTEHQVACVSHADIGRIFPEVVWQAETPLMRTAPAPMFMLSKLVRDSGFKVVLTGEGADEFLAGYDIFKEAKVRRFWAREPTSTLRPLLFKRLYPDIVGLSGNNSSLLGAFFGEGLTQLDNPAYSHAVRWRNNRRARRFFTEQVLNNSTSREGMLPAEQIHPRWTEWEALARAQYLEIKIFLSQYLLSSQGDRMAMAHSVEGRFPFLDWQVVEFCNGLPPHQKLRVLTEKYLLRKLGERWLPQEIWDRPKRPYRAPIYRSFFNQPKADYVEELLSPSELRRAGLFKPDAVAQLLHKLNEGKPLGETDDMALVGIISTQLLHHQFVTSFNPPPPISDNDQVKVCFGSGALNQESQHEVYQEYTSN